MVENGSSHFAELSVREMKRVSETLYLWEEYIENPEHNIQQKGAYKVQRDTHPEPIEIFHYSSSPSTDYYGAVWYLAAFDEDKRLLGIRNTNLEEFRSTLIATGSIEVFRRSHGVAGSIEAFNTHKLQQTINTLQGYTSLEYEIKDANKVELARLQNAISQAREEKDDNPIRELKPELEQKNRERQAWLRLYGDGGRLGFKESYARGYSALRKVFTPGESDEVPGYTIIETREKVDLMAAIDVSLNELRLLRSSQ